MPPLPGSDSPNGSHPADGSPSSSTPSKSSLRRGSLPSDEEEDKVPVLPKNVGFAKPEQNGVIQFHKGSPPSSVGLTQEDGGQSNPNPGLSKSYGWILVPYSKDMKLLSDADASRLTNPDTSRLYLVIKEQAALDAVGVWDQVISKIKGVYQSEKDANNKVVAMYDEEEVNIRHNIRLRNKGQGSPFYGYETVGNMEDGPLVRVHVECWNVRAESNEPERAPERVPKRIIRKPKSMLDV
jgi:hypothetical protein